MSNAPTITWTCAACGKPVEDGQGSVHVSMRDVMERRKAWRGFEDDHIDSSGSLVIEGDAWSDLFDLPSYASWLVHHTWCDPDKDSTDRYWFDVSRVRTHAKLLLRTAHLMEKKWLLLTNWDVLIAEKAGVDAQ